ncbi:isoprenoid synthase domain-containing protein [Mycena alexandri]|uniref:Isoprenoid synthase domain-containing protein n=1 Tax=Mycena alexandri TaxID=1745969 RepID=A0AAD6WU95_9AGAR|nr:isoprenoid synthase domain-containing protein [Mycena alexandri]
MPGTASVQLPDLLGMSRVFELRTNRHCHAVTSASENWFLTQQNILTDAEKTALRSLKIGLWASVCFPTCDPPQLRLATDFLTALVTCNSRLARAQTLRDCGWEEETSLAQNNLFRDLMPKLTSALPSESSRKRFNKHAEAFRAAQMQVLSRRQNNTLPSVEAYVDLRQDLSGLPMMFNLVEMAEGLTMNLDDRQWYDLHRSAIDVIALSTDIFAYNNDLQIENKFNIIPIFADNGVSVQGAINCSFSLIRESFQKFLTAEAALTVEQPVQGETTSPSGKWTWNPLRRRQPSNSDSPSEQVAPLSSSDSMLYLRGLKDCIVGTLNWSYETELYFGTKGDEIRQFGWVFLRAKEQE